MPGLDTLSEALPESLHTLLGTLKNVLVFKNGQLIGTPPDIKGLSITLQTEYSLDEKALITNFDKTNTFTEENLKKANTLRIHVEKGIIVKEPLNIFFSQNEESTVDRMTVILEEGAKLSMFEYLENNKTAAINYLSNARVKQGAKLTYTALANNHEKSVQGITRNAWVDRLGEVQYTLAQFGDGKTAHDTLVELKEPGAKGTVSIVALTSAKQEVVIKTLVDHQATDSEGTINHFGVASDESFLVFEGTGKIGKGFKRSIARQNNNGLLMSPNARLDANPFLLIDEYDVEASHGAAIGQIDEDQLYYLMSRGLTRKSAEELIIHGFLAPFQETLDDESLNQHLSTLLEIKTRR
jgi:Fe-S cluster assembly protein SufD